MGRWNRRFFSTADRKGGYEKCPDDYEVSMSVVLEGFRKLPLVEVRRAVMFAVREAREERRALKAQSR